MWTTTARSMWNASGSSVDDAPGMTPGLPVCDTTVLVDFLRGEPGAQRYVRGIGGAPRCSEVTRVEVLRGVGPGERSRTSRLFGAFDWIPVDANIAGRAGELGLRFRRSHPGISSVDLIIAATALEVGAELATSNVRHFPMFPRLRPVY